MSFSFSQKTERAKQHQAEPRKLTSGYELQHRANIRQVFRDRDVAREHDHHYDRPEDRERDETQQDRDDFERELAERKQTVKEGLMRVSPSETGSATPSAPSTSHVTDHVSLPKGILKTRTVPFPEDPIPAIGSIAPVKEAGKDEVPLGARWTKINRVLVNPEALEKANERFDERDDYVIVLRILTKDEIAKLAEKTREIREARESEWQEQVLKRKKSSEDYLSDDEEDRRPPLAIEAAPPPPYSAALPQRLDSSSISGKPWPINDLAQATVARRDRDGRNRAGSRYHGDARQSAHPVARSSNSITEADVLYTGPREQFNRDYPLRPRGQEQVAQRKRSTDYPGVPSLALKHQPNQNSRLNRPEENWTAQRQQGPVEENVELVTRAKQPPSAALGSVAVRNRSYGAPSSGSPTNHNLHSSDASSPLGSGFSSRMPSRHGSPDLKNTDQSGTPITCTNCFTQTTLLWHRDLEGHPLCNACSLVSKLHGVVRPLSLKTDVIKKRNRGSGQAVSPGSAATHASKKISRNVQGDAALVSSFPLQPRNEYSQLSHVSIDAWLQAATLEEVQSIVPIEDSYSDNRQMVVIRNDSESPDKVRRYPQKLELSDESTEQDVDDFQDDHNGYDIELRNISRRLVYSWLEIRRSSMQGEISQQPLIRDHAKGGGQSSGHHGSSDKGCPRQNKRIPHDAGRVDRKRPLNTTSEDSEDDDREAHDGRRKKISKDRAQVGKIWACSFWKHDPHFYSLQNNCKCSTHILDSTSRLKQHLYRAHAPPTFYCRRCFTIFDTEELLQTHSAQGVPCVPSPSPFGEKITSAQLQALKKKTPKKTQEEIWYHIYGILFPGEALPESPFLDDTSPLQVIVDDLCQYVRVEAPARLSERIRAGLSNWLPAELILEAPLNDIVESAVSHFSDLVAARAFRHGAPRSNRSTPELTSEDTEATRTTLGSVALMDHIVPVDASFENPAAFDEAVGTGRGLAEMSDISAGLPRVDDDFLAFLDFDSVSKPGNEWDHVLPPNWTSNP